MRSGRSKHSGGGPPKPKGAATRDLSGSDDCAADEFLPAAIRRRSDPRSERRQAAAGEAGRPNARGAREASMERAERSIAPESKQSADRIVEGALLEQAVEEALPKGQGHPEDHLDASLIAIPTIGDPGRAALAVRPKPWTGDRSRPAIAIDALDLGDAGVVLRAASLRGLKQQHYGRPRQDAYCIQEGAVVNGIPWLLVAVSDGVSGCTRADEGAELVSRVACEVASEELRRVECPNWASVIGEISRKVVGLGSARLAGMALLEEADEAVATAFGATLALVAVPLSGEMRSEGSFRFCSVGDSTIWQLQPDGAWRELAAPATGIDETYLTTQVAAIPKAQKPTAEGQGTAAPGGAVIIVTDGIGSALGDGTGEVALELARRWKHAPVPLQFAADASFIRRTFDDDRTAVGLWFR